MKRVPGDGVVLLFETVFLCLMGIYALCREVVFLNSVVGSTYITYSIFGLGFVFAVLNFLLFGKKKNKLFIVLFLAFLASFGLTIVVNRKYEFVSNAKSFCWMILYFFLIFSYGEIISKYHKHYYRWIAYSVVLAAVVFMILSLPMYLFDVDYTYMKSNGVVTNLGFSNQYNRLWGVFAEANYGALYALIALLFSAFLISKNEHLAAKIILALFIVLFGVFIVLSGSRSALMSMLMVAFWCGFALIWLGLVKRKRKVILSLISGVISVFVVFIVFSMCKTVLPMVKNACNRWITTDAYESIHLFYDDLCKQTHLEIMDGYYLAESIDKESGEEAEEFIESANNSLERTDLDDSDVTNGRMRRWKDAIAIWKTAPILGATPRGVISYAREHCGDTYIARYYLPVIGMPMDLLAGTGLVGLLIALVILGTMAIYIVKVTFVSSLKKEDVWTCGILLAGIIFALINSEIFFLFAFGGFAFWLNCGKLIGENYTQKGNW